LDESLPARPFDLRILGVVLAIGLLNGLVYVFLVPPWQHYDEPNHFQYAWLIAHRPGLPEPGDDDPQMDRWVLESMLAHGFYGPAGPSPDLSDPSAPVSLEGYSQLGDPPLYYWLASLPARLMPPSQVEAQLYAGRLVSLAMFLVTLLAAWGTAKELTGVGSPLRWMVPLSIALLPGFVDLMTALNNDVAAVMVFSLFLWGAVRLVQRGPSPGRVIWVLGAAVISPFTRSTAYPVLFLAPVVLLFTFLRGKRRPIAWILIGVAALAILLAVFGWGDAAFWAHGIGQGLATRVPQQASIIGGHAMRLATAPAAKEISRYEVQQLIPSDRLRLFAGQEVTLGGWAWADRPALLRVTFLQTAPSQPQTVSKDFPVGERPVFWAYNTTFQPVADRAWVSIVSLEDPTGGPTEVYLDGLVLAPGLHPTSSPPEFTEADGLEGTWGGMPFENILRNPSVEQTWPRVRSWFNQLGARLFFDYGRTDPSRALYTVLDWRAAGWYYLSSSRILFRTFWAKFGWGNVPLLGNKPYQSLFIVTLLGVLGMFLAFFRRWRRLPYAVITILAAGLIIVWSLALLRGSNYMLAAAPVYFPVARYGFPAVIPSMLFLTVGWAEVLFEVQRLFKLPVLTSGFLFIAFFTGLDLFSILSIKVFFSA
jgi:hypothetical protein